MASINHSTFKVVSKQSPAGGLLDLNRGQLNFTWAGRHAQGKQEHQQALYWQVSSDCAFGFHKVDVAFSAAIERPSLKEMSGPNRTRPPYYRGILNVASKNERRRIIGEAFPIQKAFQQSKATLEAFRAKHRWGINNLFHFSGKILKRLLESC